jgi:putative transposase
MQENDFGKIIINSWKWLGSQYPYIELDTFILMPNHLHGIIFINKELCRGDSRIAPTKSNKPKTLGRIIGAFKTVSTKKINQFRNSPGQTIWQRNYYEHIIRNNRSLNRIRCYIINNPIKWEFDKENPKNWSLIR